MNSYSNYNKTWLGLPILYYPTNAEKKCCNNNPILTGFIAKEHQGRIMDISVLCFKGANFDVQRVPHINSILHDLGKRPERVWDFTDEYKKDYNNLKVINDFLKCDS